MVMRRGVAALLVAGATWLAGSEGAQAQLSPSPWPMLQHDLRHTGRSDLLGPLFPTGTPGAGAVKSLVFYDKIKMHPVVGVDGTIYVGMGWQFCAINPNLTQKWCKPLIADVSPNAAAVDVNGYIYVGDRDNTFYKLGPDGLRIWTYNNGHEGDINSSPAIATDGTIYFSFIQNLSGYGVVAAISQNPATPSQFTLKWTFVTGEFGTTSSPAIDPNGIIYLGFADGRLRAFQDNGSAAALKWKTQVGTTTVTSSPVIGSDGTVYIGSNTGFHALDPADGRIKWSFPTLGVVGHTAAQDTDGTLYFVAQSGSTRTVYAITPGETSAQLKWQYQKNVQSAGTGYPIIAADGIVYVGFGSGVYAFNPTDGSLFWSYQTTNGIISSPLIGLPGPGQLPATPTQSGTAVLVIGSQDHKVYAISSPRTALTQNLPPEPHITVDPGLSVSAGEEVTFDALGSTNPSTDPNSDQMYFTWDFGDGSSGTGQVVNHTYWAAGPQPVTLTASDGIANAQTQVTMQVSGGGATIFCDDFTRASDPSDSLGQPTSSALPAPCAPSSPLSWMENSGNLQISGGQLVNAPVKATHIATVGNLTGVDQAVAVDFTSTTNMTAPRFGILLRFLDPQNYYVAYRLVGGASLLRLARVAGGVETVLAQTPVPNPALNSPFRLRASAAGTTLTLSLVGGASVSVSDPAFNGGTLGLSLAWQTGATPSYRADNFKACSGPPGTDCSGIQ